MQDWRKTLGLLFCSAQDGNPGDADHDGLGPSVIAKHEIVIKSYVALAKLKNNIRCNLQSSILNMLVFETNYRMACTVILVVDIFSRKSGKRFQCLMPSQLLILIEVQMAVDECGSQT